MQRHWCCGPWITSSRREAGGRVRTPEDTLDEATGKVHLRYAITAFGRQRMADTGLLDIEPKETTQ